MVMQTGLKRGWRKPSLISTSCVELSSGFLLALFDQFFPLFIFIFPFFVFYLVWGCGILVELFLQIDSSRLIVRNFLYNTGRRKEPEGYLLELIAGLYKVPSSFFSNTLTLPLCMKSRGYALSICSIINRKFPCIKCKWIFYKPI